MTAFFDTNTVLYMTGPDDRRAGRAAELVSGGGVISVQVLNEAVSVARRKFRLDWAAIDEIVTEFRMFLAVVPVTEAVHDEARRLAARYGFGIYDGAIVAAALLAGCETLWSEDMHAGLVVDERLTIRNPFA